MAKTKTPFFGLEAHGSVGRSITAQGLPNETSVRTMPLPTYRLTLPQRYQRWLYQDYVYLWNKPGYLNRDKYRSLGVPFHLTAFQYWLKYCLTNLPDITGYWKFDLRSDSVIIDSSRNANHGTVFGASPATGRIDGGFSFDGINDRIDVPSSPSLIDPPARTFLIFFNAPSFTGTERMLEHQGFLGALGGDQIYLRNNANTLDCDIINDAGASVGHSQAFIPNQWNCFGYTWDGNSVQRYLNGYAVGPHQALASPIAFSATALQCGHRNLALWMLGLIDNRIIFNRALDASEMLTWAGRRYPP